MTDTRTARYDGLAAWYDTFVRSAPFTDGVLASLARMLGPGSGRCLDLGCGTGVAFETLTSLGWSVTGVDVSRDQVELARTHAAGSGIDVVLGDAADLPFPDGSFDAVVAVLVHTDLDEPEAAWREAARVLRSGGRLVQVGMHPCFGGPTVERRDDQPHLLHPGYRERRWWHDAPGFRLGTNGVRGRAGVHHQPLSDVMNGLLGAGFQLERIEEPAGDDYPLLLSLSATVRSPDSTSS